MSEACRRIRMIGVKIPTFWVQDKENVGPKLSMWYCVTVKQLVSAKTPHGKDTLRGLQHTKKDHVQGGLCPRQLSLSSHNSVERRIKIKMKTAIIASLVASAAAFAPSKQAARSTSLKSFENEVGVQAPLGFFDPLGLLASADQERFDRLRYVELKHGRISMLAVVGYLVQEAGIRLGGTIDGSISFSDIPNGFAAIDAMGSTGLAEVVGFVGFLELFVMKDITGGEFPGDFRNGALDFGWDSFDEETKLRKRAIELNQGRAAQMGILALMVHEQLGVSILPQ